MANQIIINRSFAKELAELSRTVQKGVNAVYGKLMQPVGVNGLNLETIQGAASPSIKSVRVNDNYRIVLHQDKKGNFTFLHIDTHEKAYDWAKRNRFEVNAFTGELQIYVVDIPVVVQAQAAATPVTAPQPLFARTPSDADLLKLGVPADLIPLVRSFSCEDDILMHEEDFPRGAFDAIMMLFDGKSPDEIVREMELPKSARGSTDDVVKAVESSELSQGEFAFASNEEELNAIRNAGLEQWRVFLHPTQRKIVRKATNGPMKVLGGAGTGKTVVAMHRVKYLLENPAFSGKRILFTTFSKNLAEDIGELLKGICSDSQMERVDVVNLDAWALQYVKASGIAVRLMEQQEAEKAISVAKGVTDGGDAWSEEFLLRERANVVVANEISSLPAYLRASRVGQGTRLSAPQKRVVWNVLEAYRRETAREGLKDYDEVMILATNLLLKNPSGSPYAAVVADEVQDFGVPALRLLAALSGNTKEKPRPDSLMIVGDAHQRIFGKRAILGRCGINVMGRSYKLKINYRTTDKIRRRAVGILAGVQADDLDGNLDDNKGFHSLVLGREPLETRFDTFEQEMDAIVDAIKKWKVEDSVGEVQREFSDYAILVQSNRLCETVVAALQRRGVSAMQLKRNSSKRGKNPESIRVVTLYRAKGLEFVGVVLAELNVGVWPYVPKGFQEMDAVSQKISIDRERSLLYVGLSRAMKHAMITGVGNAPAELRR